jgi:two-component system cell cycle sensor histidine kinase/response regulator CckA
MRLSDLLFYPQNRRMTILIVDDDRMVLELLAHVLRLAGYEVLAFDRPADALQRPAKSIDLLIADVVMPRLDGNEVAERLCAVRPDLPVLLISGYPTLPPTGRPQWMALEKPFSPCQLLGAVKNLIGETKGDTE